MAVSLATINVNSMAEQHKRAKIFECLRTSRFDIFLIQESHLANMAQGKAWGKGMDWANRVVSWFQQIGGGRRTCSSQQYGQTS